ncbi:amidohydrolase [Macrococcus armenti]|uniref:amidohydrolase n=1 Tax=Macrococcus armenti TaxID=2875764 RepID=UPI001CCB38E6|nr:amidohydrolase [Macrococcus armenti]UBH10781.1 amidohydrolase [Macrococcus armenti]UBH15262.1 amidohydrolase [Macrococcus armenti]UBH17620.1 amidohydrolase [Macrococcus armenti]UBH19886.1 amidohydrolase [Macrococcus armenti]UBH22254.1 amidohydrolase [Macrococcus armenti]
MNIEQLVTDDFNEMINVRRYLHQHPEVSFHEEKTYAYILEALCKLSHFTIREHVGGKGIVAKISNGNGPSIAFRADFDALPIQDQKDVPYKSQNDGVMHACGHDGHTSILLSVARLLNKTYQSINGTVTLIFQFAEEVAPGGARDMVSDGALTGVDKVYGNHLWSPYEQGAVYSRKGALMACPDTFHITVQGKGGHGASPESTIDAIVVMAELIINLQTIISRNVAPTEQAVLTVGKVVAGDTFNIISDSAYCTGTVRTFNPEVKQMIKDAMDREVKGITAAKGATCIFDYIDGYPAVINESEAVDVIDRAAEQAGIPFKETEQLMIGEDFSYYIQHKPGAFFLTAAGKTSKGITAPHHHPLFDFDEQAMIDAVKMFLYILKEEHVYDYPGQPIL